MTLTSGGPMSDRARRRLAWAAPVVVAGAVAGGVALGAGSASGASPNLPKRTAAQLIAAVADAARPPRSPASSARPRTSGLPSLPGSGRSSASLSWQTFITGTHSAKVWIDGADKQRVALLGELSEADVVHNGNNVWTYTSDVEHRHPHRAARPRRRRDARQGRPGRAEPDRADLTPAAARRQAAQGRYRPDHGRHVDSARTVAGRAAYTLVLAPRDSRSTVSQGDDRRRRQEVRAAAGRGVRPRLQPGVPDRLHRDHLRHAVARRPSPSRPRPARRCRPTRSAPQRPPASTAAPSTPARRPRPQPRRQHPHAGATAKPKVIGSGWTSVARTPAGAGAASALAAAPCSELTSRSAPTASAVLHTALVNAVILPDGRTFVGAVTVAVLEHVAATTPR